MKKCKHGVEIGKIINNAMRACGYCDLEKQKAAGRYDEQATRNANTERKWQENNITLTCQGCLRTYLARDMYELVENCSRPREGWWFCFSCAAIAHDWDDDADFEIQLEKLYKANSQIASPRNIRVSNLTKFKYQ